MAAAPGLDQAGGLSFYGASGTGDGAKEPDHDGPQTLDQSTAYAHCLSSLGNAFLATQRAGTWSDDALAAQRLDVTRADPEPFTEHLGGVLAQ